MIEQVSDAPRVKRCVGPCGRILPATSDYFYVEKSNLRSMCKKCHIARSNGHATRRKQEKLSSLGPDVAEVSTRRCTGPCDRDLPVTSEFFARKRGGFDSRCKECKNQQRRGVQSVPLNIASAGTPDQCGSCGTTKGNILGDIDKTTHKRYGYLCTKCHRLVHDFQGDMDRMRNIFDYIDRTRQSTV